MDKQRRLRIAHILKSKGGASSQGVGDSTPPTSATAPTSPNPCPQHLPPTTASPLNSPSPNHPPSSPAPIAVVPFALAGASAEPALLDKGKRVVVVPSDDEEDSTGGQLFKRRRTTRSAPQAATSATSSSFEAESLRDNPPSANSPPQPMALEGGTEPEPEPTSVPPPAPELPLPMQDSLRGFLGNRAPRGQAEGPRRKACSITWAPSWPAPAPGGSRRRLGRSRLPPFRL